MTRGLTGLGKHSDYVLIRFAPSLGPGVDIEGHAFVGLKIFIRSHADGHSFDNFYILSKMFGGN